MTEMEPAANEELRLPITKRAISEKVFRHILDLVRKGVLLPGQRLPSERDLAESMGVGRPSLREALRALALMRVLEIRQGEGIFVSQLTPEELLEPLHFFLSLDQHSLDALFEARMAIEPSSVAIAALKIDEDTLQRLWRVMTRGADAANDPELFGEIDVEFHRLILEATENPFLIRVAQSFHELGKASRHITTGLPGVAYQAHVDHGEILAALEARSPERAREAMLQHLRNVQAAYHLSRLEP